MTARCIGNAWWSARWNEWRGLRTVSDLRRRAPEVATGMARKSANRHLTAAEDAPEFSSRFSKLSTEIALCRPILF
jgi:hypothetical protein